MFHREVRSKGAFHADEETIRAGLEALETEAGPVCIAEGDADVRDRIALPLGSDVLFLGLKARRTELRDVIRTAVLDQSIGLLIQEVFIATLRKAGVAPTRKQGTRVRDARNEGGRLTTG